MYETHADVVAITRSLVDITREIVEGEATGVFAQPQAEIPDFRGDSWGNSLLERAGLGPIDVTILRIMLAAESEPIAQRLLQRLAADPTRPGIAIDALIIVMRALGVMSYDVLHALRPNAMLVERGLVHVHGDIKVPPILRRLTMPSRAVDYLITGAMPPALTRPLMMIEPALDPAELCSVAARDDAGNIPVIEHLRRAIPRVVSGGDALWITGAPGSGRKTVLAAVLAELGYQLLVMSCEDAIAFADPAFISTLWCELLIGNAILCIADADTRLNLQPARNEDGAPTRSGTDALAVLYGQLRRANVPVVFTSDQPPSTQELDRPPEVIRFGAVTPADTMALWQARLPNADGIDEIATRFRLTPGRIVRIADASQKLARTQGRSTVIQRDVLNAVSMSVAQQVAVVGNLVEDTQTWDDIVLPQETRDSVHELIARVRHRHTVLDQWGFRRKMSKGLGLAALFSGPPGTGKTMVASIIARELGQELYQIDLSRVVSKWIGETEKNLARVFDAAEGANVLLLFDEADSLFAKRTDVKSSNDRHSNAEVNYLLQRVERFEGICLLTTNFEGSIDPAFKRRLAFRMMFSLPDEKEREQLWRRMIPKTAQIADDIDFHELGREFELAGGNIRNAVLRAAFLAANEQTVIDRELILRAVRLEYRDAGKFTTAGKIA